MQSDHAAPTRRFDLDWLRIFVFGLLILYHVGMFYVPWDWHVKSSHDGKALRPLMLLTSPWRLALLFVISGVATRYMADKVAAGPLLRARSARLLVPLLFGMLVVVPPQTWCEIVEKLGYDGSIDDFYAKYLGFFDGWQPNGKRLIVPTWNHLWFVAYLWVYTVIVIALLPLLRCPPAQRLGRSLAAGLGGPGILILPCLVLGAYRIILRPMFGETHALVGDWYLHAAFFTLFLFGFTTAHSLKIREAIGRFHGYALAIALAAWLAVVAGATFLSPGDRSSAGLGATLQMVWAIEQWCACVGVLGLAQRWLNRDAACRDYLTKAVFPFYIVHQTVIVVVGHELSPLHLSVWLEAGTIIVCTATVCMLTYEVARRVAWLRPLFGLQLGTRSDANAQFRKLDRADAT